jgi:YVTN family beta-propeller protein
MKTLALGLTMACLIGAATSWADEPAALTLEAKIPLGEVHGRIDHLAVDARQKRLYVAELGNDSVGVVDLAARRTIRTIPNLKEPQGVGYFADTDTLYVANAGDGSVQLFEGADSVRGGRIDLGADADNVRVDARAPAVVIGHGDGGLAIIDPRSRKKVGEIPLPAHPEGFQLAGNGQIYVNLPSAQQIALVDRGAGKLAQTIATGRNHELPHGARPRRWVSGGVSRSTASCGLCGGWHGS